MDASAGSEGGPSAGPTSGGVTLALIDGLFLAVLPASSSRSPAGASNCSSNSDHHHQRVVPAIPLRNVRSFLSSGVVKVATGEDIGASSDAEGGTNDDTSCIASASTSVSTSTTVTDAASMLEGLMVDLPLHRHSHIQYPTRDGLMHAYVDCEDGVVVQHDVRTRSGKHGNGYGNGNADGTGSSSSSRGNGSSVVISLKRPRTSTASANGEDGNSSLLRVKDTAGSLAADFLGVGGLDQVLLIPSSTMASTSGSIGDNIDQPGDKDTARQALAGWVAGCALTDGTSVILPRSLDQEGDAKKMLRTSSSDGTRTLRLPSIGESSKHWLALAKVICKDIMASMDIEAPELNKTSTKTFGEPSGGSQETDGAVTQQPWRAKLTKALHSRLEAEERATKRRRLDQEVRRELVRRSRRALEGLNASSGDGSTGSLSSSASSGCKPAMVRLRYGTMPLQNHGETSGGSSLGICLNLCVDVACIGGSNSTGANKKATDGLEGLHLSFSPASSQDSVSVKVKSLSGIVPRLEIGDCVSIMASVDITGLNGIYASRKNKDKNDNDKDGGFELVVIALWSNTCDSTVGEKRGSILGTLKLSYEAMLLPSSTQVSFTGNFTHEVDWSLQRKGGANSTFKTLRPTAVFEYRDPRVITIDVTKSNSFVDAARGSLRDMVESLNSSIMAGSGGRNRLELCYSSSPSMSGDDKPQNIISEHPRIIILAQSPEERIGLVRLLLNNLPESAEIVGTAVGGEIDYDEEQKKIMNALLLCIKREAKLINSQRRSTIENMGLAMVGDLAASQVKTDEIASRMMRRG